jgi:hypothetical protein
MSAPRQTFTLNFPLNFPLQQSMKFLTSCYLLPGCVLVRCCCFEGLLQCGVQHVISLGSGGLRLQ